VIPKTSSGEDVFYIKRTPGGDAETIDHGMTFPCPAADLTLAHSLHQIVATLKPFQLVISDRLHGGLIALMMRKRVIFLPVGYHKIKSFYSTWLKDDPGAAFVETQQQLVEASENVGFPTTNFEELFCQHADPALERFLLSI
jgi:exopolysaccharide biosynthesis predicted pyruvyltransferase EpsI